MKLKSVILATSVLAPGVLLAQPGVTGINSQGYLERGRLMYQSRNYAGAIDQLQRVAEMPSSASMREEADYYMALSRFERDEAGSVQALREFASKYPASQYLPHVLMTIGNSYFYHGEYGDALVAYTQVREGALDLDRDEDLLYRMAYCDLQLGNYADAQSLYNRLKGTDRYHDATSFYEAYIAYAEKRYDEAYDKFTQVKRVGDLGYQSQYYIDQIHYLNRDWDKTITLGESLLADDVNQYFNPEIHRLVGEAYYHKGNTAKARQHLASYVGTTQDPIVRSASYALGAMDYDAGNYASTIDNMGKVTGEDDGMAQSAYLYMGQAQLKQGNSKGAAISFERAAKMPHDNKVKETASYNYAALTAQGNTAPFASSIPLLEGFLNEFPGSQYTSQVESYLVDAYTTSGDWSSALASINRIKKPSKRVQQAKQTVLYNLGVQATQQGNRSQAKTYLNESIALGSHDKTAASESQLWLAENQQAEGNWTAAEKSLKAYVKSADKKSANYAKALYDLGYTQYQLKRYDDARANFKKAIATGKLSKSLTADAHDRIGDTYYYAQDFASAESSYQDAMDNTEGDQDNSMFDKAMMAGLAKNYQSKVDQLDALIKKYPGSTKAPAAMLEKGYALEAMNKDRQAAQVYQDLWAKYPKTGEACLGLLQLALVQKGLGSTDDAIGTYKKVIAAAPTSEQAKVAAEDLKVIYADRGQLDQYQAWLGGIKGAPTLDVSELDKLNFEAAEKTITAAKPDPAKMQAYLRNYPNGAYAAQALYYLGRYNYEQGNTAAAIEQLDQALAQGGDASFAEDALTMKASMLSAQDRHADAIDVYRQIVEKSTSDDNKIVAQMGMVKSYKALERWNDVLGTCDVLLQNAQLNDAESAQLKLDRAVANGKLGNYRSAESALKSLAKDVNSATGARAVVELAQLQLAQNKLGDATKTVNTLIDGGTTQSYWLARAYITLADILVKQGKKSDAREYLESLQENYPGNEADIAAAIGSRLAQLGSKTAPASSKNKKNANSSENSRKKK